MVGMQGFLAAITEILFDVIEAEVKHIELFERLL